jgi:LysR family transcriptional regulator (chromosome initiation inhibitor)
VPAAHEFGEAIRLGMGWGLLPEIEIGDDLEQRTLKALAPKSFVDVPLHWQQWRYGSAVLDGVAAAIQDAARVLR